MNAWSQLPNAHLIDWALESVKNNPHMWSRAWVATWNAAYDAASNAASNAAWNAARDAIWDAAWNAAWNAARDTALDTARAAACDSILALVAYDDCDQYLGMTYEQLKVYALLSERSQAVLLLPLKWVQENETLVTPT